MESALNHIDLKERARTIELPENDFKLLAYPLIMEQFSKIDDPAYSDIILWTQLLRGWSDKKKKPTYYEEGSFDLIIETYHLLQNGELPKYTDLLLNDLMFDTVDQTTAFWHFVNPYEYPIYSTEIGEILYGYDPERRVNDAQLELYQYDFTRRFGRYYIELSRLVTKKLNEAGYDYEVQKMRAIELTVLYGSD